MEIKDNINTEENVILTNEQISDIYSKLEEENKDKELLKAAQKETEESNYNSIEEIDIEIDDDSVPPVDEVPTVLPRDILKASVKSSELGIISDEDAEALIDLILEYRKDKSIKIYNRLPKETQNIISDFFKKLSVQNASKISRESLAKYFIDELLNTAEFDSAIKQLDYEMFEAYHTMEKDMAVIMDEAYNGIFDSIDKVREEDPEKANKIQKVKDAFERAKNFDYQLDFLKTQRPRDVRKYAIRYNAACSTFNKIVNTNLVAITIPNMEEIYEILKLWIPQYSKDQIKEFCTLICKSVEGLDFNDIGDTAYVHKLIDNIYVFKHRPTVDSEYEYYKKDLFDPIGKVIDTIDMYKNSNKEVK